PNNDINDVCHMPDSGLLFVAGESAEIQSYFIPQLGPAPSWAHFLENLTEEMEQKPQQTIYDDYKFVVRKELESLGLAHLIGSPVLKPYMHGFFVDLRLYERAKAIANPFAYDEYRMRRVQDKLSEARESRIRATTKLPKVNRSLAMRLMQMQKNDKGRAHESDSDDEGQKRLGGRQRRKAHTQAATATAVLEDSRFKDIFSNPDFEVDEDADEFKQLHTPFKKMKLQQPKSKADDDSSEDEDMGFRNLESVPQGSDADSDNEFFE
ncbi:Small ribosomal subunit biogenesis, partial [Coemansia sp. RSA 2618]